MVKPLTLSLTNSVCDKPEYFLPFIMKYIISKNEMKFIPSHIQKTMQQLEVKKFMTRANTQMTFLFVLGILLNAIGNL